jgi:hypothetical protein
MHSASWASRWKEVALSMAGHPALRHYLTNSKVGFKPYAVICHAAPACAHQSRGAGELTLKCAPTLWRCA